jgi:hypothetical protein
LSGQLYGFVDGKALIVKKGDAFHFLPRFSSKILDNVAPSYPGVKLYPQGTAQAVALFAAEVAA